MIGAVSFVEVVVKLRVPVEGWIVGISLGRMVGRRLHGFVKCSGGGYRI